EQQIECRLFLRDVRGVAEQPAHFQREVCYREVTQPANQLLDMKLESNCADHLRAGREQECTDVRILLFYPFLLPFVIAKIHMVREPRITFFPAGQDRTQILAESNFANLVCLVSFEPVSRIE